MARLTKRFQVPALVFACALIAAPAVLADDDCPPDVTCVRAGVAGKNSVAKTPRQQGPAPRELSPAETRAKAASPTTNAQASRASVWLRILDLLF